MAINVRQLLENPTHLLTTEGTAEDSNLGYSPVTGLPISSSTQSALDLKQSLTLDHSSITYAGIIDLDLAALTGKLRTISLTGNLTLTTSNRANGRQVGLRLLCDATIRNLTFPVGWVFVGNTRPTAIQANKVGMLNLIFFGTNDSDCVASYGESV